MSDDNEYLSLSFSMKKDDLITALEGALSRHPHCNIMARVIVNNLINTTVGIDQLTKAFLGIENKTDFCVGDKVWVPFRHLPTWRCNVEEMKKHGLIFQEKVECEIKNIDLYSGTPLRVSFISINNDLSRVAETYSIELHHAERSDSGNIDLLDDEHQQEPGPDPDPNLPF